MLQAKKTVFNLAHMQKPLSKFSSVPTLQFWIAVKFNSTDLTGCTSPPCNLSRVLNNVDHLTRHSQHKAIGDRPLVFLVFYSKDFPWESNLSLSMTWFEINGCLVVPDNPIYQWGNQFVLSSCPLNNPICGGINP